MLSQLQYHIYHETVFRKVVGGHMRRKNRLYTEEYSNHSNKQQKPPVLHLVHAYNTSSPHSSPITSTTAWLSVPQESDLPYSELIWRRGCFPFAECVPHISSFQQIRGTELFSVFLASRPCLLSVSAEERITKTKGPSSFPRFTLGRQEALVTKQSKRFSQLSIRKKSDHQRLEQSSTGCPETLMNLYLRGFS